MSDFEKNKRSILLQEKFYLENKPYIEGKLQRDIFAITPPDWIINDPHQGAYSYHRGLSWVQVSDSMEYAQLLYSAGHPMAEVVAATHDMLERFHKHFDIDFPDDNLQLWEPDSYAYILWLLGLAVLSNHKESLTRIPGWLAPDLDENGDHIKGGAPLVDAPLKAVLDLIGYQGRLQIEPKPFFPKSVYMLLPELSQAQSIGADRAKLLQQYLKGWHKTNKDTYWYDYHEVRDGELFFGYWSFEAGMLAVLQNIPMEGKFKEMSFYPKDYVDYARDNGFATLK